MGRHSAPDEQDNPTGALDVVRPQLQIVRGDPSPDEVAVVTAVLTAVAASGQPSEAEQVPPRNRWADPFDVHQRPWLHGVGGWRTSLRG